MTSEDRSKYDAAVLATACYIANASDDVRVIEQELDAIPADITEPWTDAAAQ